MAKYHRLHEHLLTLKGDIWHARFDQIERILGFSLPQSARKYNEWWANQDRGQCRSWVDAGWITGDLNLTKEAVVFQRNGKKRAISHGGAATKKEILHDWDKQEEIGCYVEFTFDICGTISLDNEGRLKFPSVESVPGIYRIRIKMRGKESVYIGESDNLKRRFRNYRNPGSTQQTSLRIGGLLTKALEAGAQISISYASKEAFMRKGNKKVSLDFSSKVVRCLLENVAILNGAEDIERLNRASV